MRYDENEHNQIAKDITPSDNKNALNFKEDIKITNKNETEPKSVIKPTDYKTVVSESNSKVLDTEDKVRHPAKIIPKQRK